MVKRIMASPPRAARSHEAVEIGRTLAVIFLIMAVAQLFSFEKFIPLIQSFQLPGGDNTGTAVAGLIVVCEVLALPFLLRMSLSPLFRVMSMVCGWVVAAIWTKLTLWLMWGDSAPHTVGLFGASVPLPFGWWAVFFCLVLVVLASWASWGMWPIARRKGA